jgi:hypothetical protein
MYFCMYTYIRIFVYTYVCMHACMYVSYVCVCVCVCMHACVCVFYLFRSNVVCNLGALFRISQPQQLHPHPPDIRLNLQIPIEARPYKCSLPTSPSHLVRAPPLWLKWQPNFLARGTGVCTDVKRDQLRSKRDLLTRAHAAAH